MSTLVICPKCGAGAGAPCRTRGGKPKATCKERESGSSRPAAPVAAPAPTPTADTDFDEHTPPPRRRPEGSAVPRFVRLPAGEDVKALFAEWDRAGRIPAGSILCALIGHASFGGKGQASCYRLLAASAGVPGADPLRRQFGEELSDETLDDFDIGVDLRRSRDPVWYVVFSPVSPPKESAHV